MVKLAMVWLLESLLTMQFVFLPAESMTRCRGSSNVPSQVHSSLQGINQCALKQCPLVRGQYQTTGSGSILIQDVTAATKLMKHLGPPSPTLERYMLKFEEDSICIEMQWNEIQKHLVLRRVSGDHSRYANICRQLIQNVL